MSDMQVKIESKYFYPDVLVDCSNLSDDSTFTETPILIVEVLSKSTRRADETTKRMAYMQSTADVIRYLFESMTDPDVISFGGGAPAGEALPVELVHEIAKEVLVREKRGVQALQYGNPIGIPDLRQAVIDHLLLPKGLRVGMENVMIVAGGMETMNLVSQLYLEPGDIVLVESPTFLQSIQIFKMFEARCIACETDDQGPIS